MQNLTKIENENSKENASNIAMTAIIAKIKQTEHAVKERLMQQALTKLKPSIKLPITAGKLRYRSIKMFQSKAKNSTAIFESVYWVQQKENHLTPKFRLIVKKDGDKIKVEIKNQ